VGEASYEKVTKKSLVNKENFVMYSLFTFIGVFRY
jgi:hypothetical protein